jgi:hypothetical protein
MAWAKPLGGAADPGLEQGPEVDATWLGVVEQSATETRRQRREGMATDEVVQLGRGRNPEAESWTWQQGEINLQGQARSKPSRACETLRAERRWAWDARQMWTRWIDAAKRKGTPRKAPGRESKRADVDTTNSGGEPSSHEDEPAFFTECGGRHRRKTITVRQK